MESLLVCPVCCTELDSPVTLSCGYTVCKPCIPPPFKDSQQYGNEYPTFICPVKRCDIDAHLFCREQGVHVDVVVERVLDILGKEDKPSLPKRARLPPISSMPSSMIANLLECPGCSTVFRDPITTHCGHVYCRLCLLKFKIVSKPCMQCKSPLPQFNHFFNRAATNRIIQRLIEAHVSGVSDRETISDLESSFQRSVFVTGLVVLPKQHVRLPVFTPNHLRMLRHAIFSSGSRLLLAAVHSSRSTMAKFGTIAEITMVDQCKSGTLLLDVVGLERFTASYIEDDHLGQHMKGDMSLLTAQCTLIRNHHPRDLQDHEDIEALASHIRHLLKQLARSPPPALLLGVLWFETMQRIHGQLPATGAEDTLWWTAAALPLNAAERYELLRTIPLYDKLDLVLSRIKQLISQ